MIGNKGLTKEDLIICQATTFDFSVQHLDTDDQPINHDGWTVWFRLRPKISGRDDIILNDCVTEGEDGKFEVEIPPETTKIIPVGKYLWDIITEDPAGKAVRLAYGSAELVDTYARD